MPGGSPDRPARSVMSADGNLIECQLPGSLHRRLVSAARSRHGSALWPGWPAPARSARGNDLRSGCCTALRQRRLSRRRRYQASAGAIHSPPPPRWPGSRSCSSLPLLQASPRAPSGLPRGLAAGAVGGIGLMIFYAGLAEGPMSIDGADLCPECDRAPCRRLPGGRRACERHGVYVGALDLPGGHRPGQRLAGPAKHDGASRDSCASGDGGGREAASREAASREAANLATARSSVRSEPPVSSIALARRGFQVRASRVRPGGRGNVRALLRLPAQRRPVWRVLADCRIQAGRIPDRRHRRGYHQDQAGHRIGRTQAPAGDIRFGDPRCERQRQLRARYQGWPVRPRGRPDVVVLPASPCS